MIWQLSFHSLHSFQAVIPILIFMTDTLWYILCYFKEYVERPSPKKKVLVCLGHFTFKVFILCL